MNDVHLKSHKLNFWIAVCATVVAISGLALSIWSAYTQRIHDRLSVRPQLLVSYEEPEGLSTYQLRNVGYGPAKVHWFEIRVDNEPQKSWKEFTAALGNPHKPFRFAIPSGATYPADAIINIYTVSDQDAGARMRAKNNMIEFSYCYCSLYKQCWIAKRWADEIETDKCEPTAAISLQLHPIFLEKTRQ